MTGFVESLIALVAVANVLPILPVVQEFTAELPASEARSYRLRALLQGNLVGLGFMLGAPFLFYALGLTLDDLRIAGGVVLLTYATHDILFSRARRNRLQMADEHHDPGPAIAPLGVPIFVGPATLSMLLVLSEIHGNLPVAAALVVNLVLNVACVLVADPLLSWLGEGASRAVGKVMSIVLAALGAGMLRAGVAGLLA